ncbi:Hypothetical_protein [Hexamita inflata]|uniref:Hypothetical_protein n=1 Tax=Hexamita inflata TaxID=28002 RepID=A0ABP1GLX3_9EUKA
MHLLVWRQSCSFTLGFLLSHFPMYFKQIYRQQFDSHYKCEAGVRLQTRQRKQCAAFVQSIRSLGIMKVCYHLTFGAGPVLRFDSCSRNIRNNIDRIRVKISAVGCITAGPLTRVEADAPSKHFSFY